MESVRDDISILSYIESWIIKEREFGSAGNLVFYSWCLLTVNIALFLMLYFTSSALNGSVHSITLLSGIMKRGKYGSMAMKFNRKTSDNCSEMYFTHQNYVKFA